MWHPTVKIKLISVQYKGICLPNLVSLAYGCSHRQTDRHGLIDSVSDPEQVYIYFMGSQTPFSASYIDLHKVSIPIFSHFECSNERNLRHVCALDTVGWEKGKRLRSQRAAGAETEGFIRVKGEQLTDLFVYFMGMQIHLTVN